MVGDADADTVYPRKGCFVYAELCFEFAQRSDGAKGDITEQPELGAQSPLSTDQRVLLYRPRSSVPVDATVYTANFQASNLVDDGIAELLGRYCLRRHWHMVIEACPPSGGG